MWLMWFIPLAFIYLEESVRSIKITRFGVVCIEVRGYRASLEVGPTIGKYIPLLLSTSQVENTSNISLSYCPQVK